MIAAIASVRRFRPLGRLISLAGVCIHAAACGSETPPGGSAGTIDSGGTIDAGEDRATPAADANLDTDVDGFRGTHRFRRMQLYTEFFCEGATYADFDGDRDIDVALGPRWYEGPSFTVAHEIYEPQAFDPKGYSDCFFLFSRDFDSDGAIDILRVGFPGTDASLFHNPGSAGGRWPRAVVVDVVDTESPYFVDLTGDGSAELVFGSQGRLVWAGPVGTDPTRPWNLHPLTPSAGFQAFTHGLGVGDVDKDGHRDVLEATGWWRQPPSLQGDPVWERHVQPFGPGGGQMETADIDGDGDADVVASPEAHGYGLSWFEQTTAGTFVEHVIVPNDADAGSVPLHEPHALAVADIDRDGDPDIIAGERFWGHIPGGMPDFAAPARLYWFELVRSQGAVSFVPHVIDDASGVGTQVTVGDVTGDGLDDILIANKKGGFVFVHELAP